MPRPPAASACRPSVHAQSPSNTAGVLAAGTSQDHRHVGSWHAVKLRRAHRHHSGRSHTHGPWLAAWSCRTPWFGRTTVVAGHTAQRMTHTQAGWCCATTNHKFTRWRWQTHIKADLPELNICRRGLLSHRCRRDHPTCPSAVCCRHSPVKLSPYSDLAKFRGCNVNVWACRGW